MTRVIYKYEIPAGVRDYPIAMPVNARILYVGAQHEFICIWAMVDTDGESTPRYFNVFGTGEAIDEGREGSYLGTVLLYGGRLVWHVFEVSK